ncbi:MAG: hypothetical protein JWN70_1251 [Planctomycetaceae bacterium]|nr:hypothetical protein [Planctomycetaceae bacterium]
MQNASRMWIKCGLAVLTTIAAGCGGSGQPNNHRVSGTITFDGQPVASGQIILFPVEAGGTPDAANIKDGKYSLLARKGEKRVQIEATRDVPGKIITLPPPLTGTKPVTEMYIPIVYNSKSKLTVKVPETSSSSKFDFKLTADGSGS